MQFINYEMVRVHQEDIRRQTQQTEQRHEFPSDRFFIRLDVGAVVSRIRDLLPTQKLQAQPQLRQQTLTDCDCPPGLQPCCEGVATT